MRTTLIALLATAALAAPALAASSATDSPAQQPQNNQPVKSQAQQSQSGSAVLASNQQTVPPKSLSRSEMRTMQTALNNDGFNAGQVDGKWGPRTSHAVRQFDQSKGIQSQNGQLTEGTLAQLGVNTNEQGQNAQQPQKGSGNNQNNSR
jgi:peptidoglycan hydrolase-like protein with peptidoglycan-binding domain